MAKHTIRGTTEFVGTPFKYPRKDKPRKGYKGDDYVPGTHGTNVDKWEDGCVSEQHSLMVKSGGKNIKVGGR